MYEANTHCTRRSVRRLFNRRSSGHRTPPGAPSVTFQVEVNYVDVDVVVTDEKGNFVSGLTREDFEVFEDGKPQKVDTFAYVEIPVEQDNAVTLVGRNVRSRSTRSRTAGRLPGVCT